MYILIFWSIATMGNVKIPTSVEFSSQEKCLTALNMLDGRNFKGFCTEK